MSVSSCFVQQSVQLVLNTNLSLDFSLPCQVFLIVFRSTNSCVNHLRTQQIFYSSVNPVLTCIVQLLDKFFLNLRATLYHNYKFVIEKKLVIDRFVSVSHLNFSKLRQIYF